MLPELAAEPATCEVAPRCSAIDPFCGEHRFLSNSWPAEVRLDGRTYPSVEHAYKAAKTPGPEVGQWTAVSSWPGPEAAGDEGLWTVRAAIEARLAERSSVELATRPHRGGDGS